MREKKFYEILVTGGAGFMGSHVVDSLISAGKKVVVIDDLSGGFRENVNPKATFIKGSIFNRKLVNSVFESRKIKFVFHLAAYAAEGLSHYIKRYNYNNNLIGSINLINAAVNHNVECFVFTSSIAVYGNNALPMTEDMTPMPVDSYGIAKLAVEQELNVSHDLFGLNYIIFRPHNVYGEKQNIGDKYRNVIGIFMNQIMMRKPLTIFGKGEQTRAFTYIKDIAPVMAQSIYVKDAYNQIFNIGADKQYTVNELAAAVSKAMGVKPDIRYVEEREEVKHAYCAHNKINKFFNGSAEYSLSDGLAVMAEWSKSNGSKRSKKFKNIEIQKNLPPTWLS
jgi:UDP-glucose 4-epimerase